MSVLRFVVPFCASFALCACGGAASTPAALAKALQKALDSGDLQAARTLADLGDAPGELQFFYFDLVRECAGEAKCTAATAPLDDEFRNSLIDQAKQEGGELPAAEGLITVASKSADGTGSGTMKMPYAKIGGEYKIASLHLGPAELAKRRTQTGEQLLKAMFAGGIYENATQTRRTDWETAATKLPADGGEAGAALVRQTRAMAAAVDAKDPDAAMKAGGRMSQFVFADKGYDGKPIALEDRRRKLQVQSLRMLRDVKVSGGYRLGDDAALVIEARDGVGWTQRGAVLMSLLDSEWDIAGKQLVGIPPTR